MPTDQLSSLILYPMSAMFPLTLGISLRKKVVPTADNANHRNDKVHTMDVAETTNMKKGDTGFPVEIGKSSLTLCYTLSLGS